MALIALAASALILLGLFLQHKHEERHSREMTEEWIRVFGPDRCMICAYHRFGLQEGLTTKAKPDPHSCPEKSNGNP